MRKSIGAHSSPRPEKVKVDGKIKTFKVEWPPRPSRSPEKEEPIKNVRQKKKKEKEKKRQHHKVVKEKVIRRALRLVLINFFFVEISISSVTFRYTAPSREHWILTAFKLLS